MCGPITSRFHTTDLATESAFADYLIATARCDPLKFIDVSRCVLFDTPFVGSLLSNHLEDSVRRHQKPGNQSSLNRNNMLPLICTAEKAGHVIISFYPLEEGYSISLRHKDGKWVESVRIPYAHSDVMLSVDQGLFPPELSDVLQSVTPPVIRNGHLVVELRDYRPPVISSDVPYDRSFHLLSSGSLSSKQLDGNSNAIAQSPSNSSERRLIDAICCDPRPAVFLVRSAYARNSKQIYSQKLAGILKKQFKTSLRKQNPPISASSRSLFSLFNPQFGTRPLKMRSEICSPSSSSPSLLSGLIEQYPLRSPSDDIFMPRTQHGMMVALPPLSFADLLVDEIVLKQLYFPQQQQQQQPALCERFIRIRVYFSQRTWLFSVHHDFAVSLPKALSMVEEHLNMENPSLGTQGDVLAYLKQFVSLLAVEGGGKVEVVHYKQVNKQFGLALDRRGLRAFDQSATANSRTIKPQPVKEVVEAVEEPRPGSGCTGDLTLMSGDRQNAPRTPSSYSSSSLAAVVTGLNPNNLIANIDHPACENE